MDAVESLKILSIEDEEDDFDLQMRELRKAGVSVAARRVDSLRALQQALKQEIPDVILCDYRLDGFTGFEAIRLIKKIQPRVPVIFVSGTVGEDVAVKSLLHGAKDYLLKINLRRLPNAVRNVVDAVKDELGRQSAEQAVREREAALSHAQAMAELAHSVWSADTRTLITWSENLPAIIGHSVESMPKRFEDCLTWVGPEDRERVASVHLGLHPKAGPVRLDYPLLKPDGSIIHVAETVEWMPPEKHATTGTWFITIQDVTSQRVTERNLRLLIEISQTVAPTTHFEAGLGAALSAIAQRTGFGYGEAWVPDAREAHMVLSPEWYGDPVRFAEFRKISATIRFESGQGVVGRVWKTRKPKWLADLAKVDKRRLFRIEAMRSLGKTSAMVVPIVGSGDRVLAVLAFLASRATNIDKTLVEVVVSAANHLGALLERKLFADALRESQENLRLILDSTAEAIYGVDLDGNCTFANVSCARLLGFASINDLIGKNTHQLMHHSRADGGVLSPEDCRIYRAYREGLRIHADDEVFWRADGASFPVEYWSYPVERQGKIIGAVVAFLDITERKSQQVSIERLTRMLEVLSGINSTIVRVRDRSALFEQACEIAVAKGKFSFAWIGLTELESHVIRPVSTAGTDGGFLDSIRPALESGEIGQQGVFGEALSGQTIVINNLARDHRILFPDKLRSSGFKSAVVMPLLADGSTAAIFVLYASVEDYFDPEEVRLIAELRDDISFALSHLLTEERAWFLANYDSVTSLPNRTLFDKLLHQHMLESKATGQRLAVITINVRRLRHINDTYGRSAGDHLLFQLGERLRAVVKQQETVARLSGDLFAVVRVNVGGATDLSRLVETESETCFGSPFRIDKEDIRVAANCGIAIYPDDGTEVDALMSNSEAALERARQLGEKYLFYSRDINASVKAAQLLENKLRVALERGQFVLHYQPKYSTADKAIVGCEALIRWNDPEQGLVPPGRFIPLLEETGLILEVGRWALEQAADEYVSWRKKGLKPSRIAVNVSPIQLRREDFVEDVSRAAVKTGEECGLDIEITEGVIMVDIEPTMEKLRSVRKLGVGIAIDDFGTGYSSLRYLSKLPIHSVKIDRSFVMNLENSPDDMSIVAAIISLAHSLNLKVVAEGVETEEQARLLRLLRCDELQGYLYSRPVPASEFETMLSARDEAVR